MRYLCLPIVLLSTFATAQQPGIVLGHAPGKLERLAAQEVRRYAYQCTGTLLVIGDRKQTGSTIVIGRLDRPLLHDALGVIPGLGDQDYVVVSRENERGRVVYLTGKTDAAVLYAAYRFAEILGVRFYLHGDVIPDEQKPLELPVINETGKPRFDLRGIQPFHDFPEGPDWWGAQEYKAIVAQMPKLRMNFIGLHTYPIVEPTVWIGEPTDIGPGAKVRFSYPTRYYNTAKTVGWGFDAKKTSDYACGGALLFDRDDYGADFMQGLTPEPATPEQSNEMFARVGTMLGDVFTLAHELGIKTCVGTETPLVVPPPVQEKGKNDPNLTAKLYEGIFERIQKTYPLDYYWLWTPEPWTWEGVKQEQIDATIADIRTAYNALHTTKSSFQLATCGWVLGPPNNRSLFDQALPKDMPVSCINRAVGHDPVEPGFAQVKNRDKWAIPWLEDDPAMTSPQLWVARMNRDAQDALNYGCNGLMGIHWRTRVIAPNVAALTQASWSRGAENAPPRRGRRNRGTGGGTGFYADWTLHEFGPDIAKDTAKIFEQIDGKLPRPADWVGGPGGYKPDARPWGDVQKEYAFVDEFATLGAQVKGAGNAARFQYWNETFQFLRETGHMDCVYGELTRALEAAKKEADAATKTKIVREQALPKRIELARVCEAVYARLLATVSTTGEMGTVCNFEQHVFPKLLSATAKEIETVLGAPLPAEVQLRKDYTGPARLIVTTARTSLERGEPLELKAIALSPQVPTRVTLHYRPLGKATYTSKGFDQQERNTYGISVHVARDFEWYVDAEFGKGTSVCWPVTAPAINQTVVVME